MAMNFILVRSQVFGVARCIIQVFPLSFYFLKIESPVFNIKLHSSPYPIVINIFHYEHSIFSHIRSSIATLAAVLFRI